MTQYFVAVGDTPRGPFTRQQLADGVVPLTPQVLVSAAGTTDWVAAGSVAELADLVGASWADEPPPYVPAGPATRAGPGTRTAFTPKWIVVYAMLGSPIVWAVQRCANVLDALAYQDASKLPGEAMVLLLWGSLTLATTGLVFAGGSLLWAKAGHRPRLLRFGLGCSVGLGLAAAATVIYGLSAEASKPSGPDPLFNVTDLVAIPSGRSPSSSSASLGCGSAGRRSSWR